MIMKSVLADLLLFSALFTCFHVTNSLPLQEPSNCPRVSDNEKCNSQYVKLFLYTRVFNSPNGEYVGFLEDGSNTLNQSHYDASKPSIILIHGYTSDYKYYLFQELKEAILKKEDTNIWLVDYSPLVPYPCYLESVHNVDYVGRCLAGVIRALGSPTSGLHLIGFSLGAHVTGAAARHLIPYVIPRITGLDPAGPLFISDKNRLSSGSAQFVDVIHTNAFGDGNVLPLGHVDFFMNGGILQPGCHGIEQAITCSHERAVWYYLESVTTEKGFWGWSCDKYISAIEKNCHQSKPYIKMGYYVDTKEKGLVYVPTTGESPFAKGIPLNN